MTDLEFTGERVVPGRTPKRIEDDHIERYRFATSFVRGKSVLDIACGTGYGCLMLAQAGAASVEGVDISEEAIEYARRYYKASNVTFAVSDLYTYERPNKYDIVVSFETIEHVADCESALRTFHLLLKPKGTLIISSPNRLITSPDAKSINDKPSNPHDLKEYTIEELRSALAADGFSPEGIYGQRQRRTLKSKYLRRLQSILVGNPDINASPGVTVVLNKVPRYFIIVAKKLD